MLWDLSLRVDVKLGLLSTLTLFSLSHTQGDIIPITRWSHSTLVVKEKLYIIGGKCGVQSIDAVYCQELLSLDLTATFPTKSPAWTREIYSGVLPQVAGHSAVLGGFDEAERIIVYGGATSNPYKSPVYNYHLSTQTWTNPTLNRSPPRRYEHSVVVNLERIMYIFGGITDELTGVTGSAQFDELAELNTLGSVWTVFGWQPSNPSPRYHHTASLVNNRHMMILGGYSAKDGMLNMGEIVMFDTISHVWTAERATGQIPRPRREHTAIVKGELVIVFGGTDQSYTEFYNDVAVLNTTSMTWSIPMVKNPPRGRYAHSAVLHGDHMLVSFAPDLGYSNGLEDSHIHILDTNTWEFLDKYTPSVSKASTSQSAAPTHMNSKLPLIIGGAIGLFMVTLVLLGLLIYIFRKRLCCFRGRKPKDCDEHSKMVNFDETDSCDRFSISGSKLTRYKGKTYYSNALRHSGTYMDSATLEERIRHMEVQTNLVYKQKLYVVNP
ncbi:galactose oxidase [Basidiobolus meristosporus CBS 931.73]|uniref:Galactose oxidase n=1 Tax=Basidiobolus meristosporus CBS 931.73 TaxID=1314790 RepID=A0A1Y1WTW4_9FUNG|nr:galactose oxidase [Basidiobolus meristosporus CBS 931.73]|eukprot:ORX76953.1 galactose oxidase [Basidiobolus meristosporus CBS 931.73]